MYFIDLFCGIGGFHQAIRDVARNLNDESICLFAADNDLAVSRIYHRNYDVFCHYDLSSDETHEIINEAVGLEEVDFLFAGFPCQPFSKAGNQEGFDDEIKGSLFFQIIRIVNNHHPRFLLLENVRNLHKHDNGNTWRVISQNLIEQGYLVDYVIISPNEIEGTNIPALRERVFIMCYRNDINVNEDGLFRGRNLEPNRTSIYKYGNKEKGLKSKYFDVGTPSDLEDDKKRTIEMWDDLHQRLINNGRKIISPLWPHYFDCDLSSSTEPEWKKRIIYRNMEFYKENKDIYDLWYEDYKEHFNTLTRSDQKFEWNAGDAIRSAWDGIIQFRPSGVRVKKPDFIPTLVAITQTPILGVEKRYLKPSEMARLYGFKKLDFNNQPLKETYKQLGNTVSVDVVKYLIETMLNNEIQE